jgi:hypothetical protein
MASRRSVRAILIGLVSFASLLTAAAPAADAQTPKRGGMLRVAYGNDILGMDFHTQPGYEMLWVVANI